MVDPIKHYSLTTAATVYDEDALTALELAARTAGKVNEAVAAFNALDEDVKTRLGQIPADVAQEVDNHIQSGDFDRAISVYLNNLNERLDNLLGQVSDGTTTMDAEVIDARTGVNGVVYGSAGTATRSQIKSVDEARKRGVMSYTNVYNGVFNDKTYINPNGQLTQHDTHFTTDYIPITFGATYHFTKPVNIYGAANVAKVACFNASKVALDPLTGTYDADRGVLSVTVTNPDAVYIRTSQHTAYRSAFMVIEGDGYPETFLPYQRNTAMIPADTLVMADGLKTPLDIEDVAFIFSDGNRFNSATARLGEYLNSVGISTNAPNYGISDYIRVYPDTTYTVTKVSAITAETVGQVYDGNYHRIGAINATPSDDGTHYSFLTPSNARFIRVNWDKSPAFMVCGLNYPSMFIPYGLTLDPRVKVSRPNNALNGKTAYFNGDSICSGAGWYGGYGTALTDTYGLIVNNQAVSGGTIVTVSGKHSIAENVSKSVCNEDFMIIEGGVNDASLNVPIGEYSDSYNVTVKFDTFFSAMDNLCYRLARGGKKVGFIIPHGIISAYQEGGAYYDMQVKVLKKWGIPYLDLTKLCPPLNYISGIKGIYTLNGDGWHPNELGYRTFYADKIAAWMATL